MSGLGTCRPKECLRCFYVTKDTVQEYIELFYKPNTYEWEIKGDTAVVQYGGMTKTIFLDHYYVEDHEDIGWTLYTKEAFAEKFEVVKECEPKESSASDEAHWMYTEAYPHRVYCSACYKTLVPNAKWIEQCNISTNYCPNCGRKMEDNREQ